MGQQNGFKVFMVAFKRHQLSIKSFGNGIVLQCVVGKTRGCDATIIRARTITPKTTAINTVHVSFVVSGTEV